MKQGNLTTLLDYRNGKDDQDFVPNSFDPIQGCQGTSSCRRSFDLTSLAGRFAPKIAKKFPFAQTAEAYRYIESNQQVGNIVITVPYGNDYAPAF
jgi:hypothetical protein